jgi:hypothetical protein
MNTSKGRVRKVIEVMDKVQAAPGGDDRGTGGSKFNEYEVDAVSYPVI